MILNVGSLDRVARLAIGAALILFVVFGSTVAAGSALGVVLIVVGLVLSATAVFSFCPLYALLGLRTRSAD
ncbi:DUF2892 domain-containing protein [Rhizobiaceae bacterium]|nr:DUF2892 domain-containing protein [Rhizobiaceae bacterium]